MKEPRRSLYLAAIGIDGYVSRAQLPGAAPTRRLVRAGPRSALAGVGAPTPQRERTVRDARDRPAPGTPATSRAQIASPGAAGVEATKRIPVTTRTVDPAQFSLAAIVAGGMVWLEELEQRLLAREQLQLVAAMARAVAPPAAGGSDRPEVTQFNWPMHDNAQLDRSEEAGRAALAGLIARKLEQHRCRALVLLGETSAQRLPDDILREVQCVRIPSTLDMLEQPALKKTAWAALLPFAGNA